MTIDRRKGFAPHFTKPARPQPVYRGTHWILRCGCGCKTVLNECSCDLPKGEKHVEEWQDGCSWVAKHYPQPKPASAPTVPRTDGKPALDGQEKQLRALLERGYTQREIAAHYGVSQTLVHFALRTMGLTRQYQPQKTREEM